MARGENPIPGSSSYSCHCALTLLFPYALGPGHTGRARTITLSFQPIHYSVRLFTQPLAQPVTHAYVSFLQPLLIHTHYPLLSIHLSSHSFPDGVIHLFIHQPIYPHTHIPAYPWTHLPILTLTLT